MHITIFDTAKNTDTITCSYEIRGAKIIKTGFILHSKNHFLEIVFIKQAFAAIIIACMMALCLDGVAAAEDAQVSSFDFDCAATGDGFASGTVMYIPDFTGSGSRWEILAVSGDNDIVYVTVIPIALPCLAEDQDSVKTYEVRFEGTHPGDAFVRLELCKDGNPSWRYNFYVIVDPSLDVKIQTAELMPAFGDTSHVKIDYGVSEHFGQEEMDAAIAVILADLKAGEWSGFDLLQISYISDERSRRCFDEYVNRPQYAYRDKHGRPYVDGICFETSFMTRMTDDGWTGFEIGKFSGYKWILLLTEDKEWDIITTGF